MIQETLRHLQANVPGVLNSEDAEFVHQARVAMRRLRAAQKTFARIAPADAGWQAILAELRWLSELLGNTRDLDVLLGETLPPIEAALGADIDFEPLRETLLHARNAELRKVRHALSSARYAKLLERLRQWLEATASQPDDRTMLRDFARHALERRWQRVERLIRKLDTLDRAQRHALRKRAKELRYALEFFGSLFDNKRAGKYLTTLQALQQVIGTMNDGATAQRLLEEVIPREIALAPCGGAVIGWIAAEARQSELKLEAIGKALESSEAYW